MFFCDALVDEFNRHESKENGNGKDDGIEIHFCLVGKLKFTNFKSDSFWDKVLIL